MSTELTKFLMDNFTFSNKTNSPQKWGDTIPYPLYLTALNCKFSLPNLLIGDILFCTREFYVLEAMNILAQNTPTEKAPYGLIPFMKSHEKWKNDFKWYRNKFIEGFASAIYDYIIKTVAGELRYCFNKNNYCINKYLLNEIDISSRDSVFDSVYLFNPREILQYGDFLFNPAYSNWECGYGGLKWQNIAKAGMLYKKMPDSIFIDHCVDLSHNNSSFFDKGASTFLLKGSSSYLNFLGMKRYASPTTVLEHSEVVSVVTENLLRRGVALGILPGELSNLTICHFHRLFDKIVLTSNTESSAVSRFFISFHNRPQLFEPYGFNPDRKITYDITYNFFQSNAIAWNTLVYKPVVYQNNPIGEIRKGPGPYFDNFPCKYLVYGRNYYEDEMRRREEERRRGVSFYYY